ncbi:hypothetical protein RFI_09396 [Reticulomyxa filosa]|uniref:Uncharacterized protein n=1 Tax=Reticulomyxa filosa TaxID=46433 RepID=X6NQV6_RETFI|nr:hypothetical protein RFI_09396 [Reticulomyxa filosa]|eukprot:ETO27742.1 hypothetical protein RFI_09396 [Reticulomyxa filosa]
MVLTEASHILEPNISELSEGDLCGALKHPTNYCVECLTACEFYVLEEIDIVNIFREVYPTQWKAKVNAIADENSRAHVALSQIITPKVPAQTRRFFTLNFFILILFLLLHSNIPARTRRINTVADIGIKNNTGNTPQIKVQAQLGEVYNEANPSAAVNENVRHEINNLVLSPKENDIQLSSVGENDNVKLPNTPSLGIGHLIDQGLRLQEKNTSQVNPNADDNLSDENIELQPILQTQNHETKVARFHE